MKIHFHRRFGKQFKKLSKKERKKTQNKIVLFSKDTFSVVLSNYALKGKFSGYRSINITGDLRAIYKKIGNDKYLFVDVDTHSKLYS